MPLSLKQRQEIANAIRQLRALVRWKPGKDREHLATRMRYGHLPNSTTIEQYNLLITTIVRNNENTVYGYVFGNQLYVGVIGEYHDVTWLVLFGTDGTMETAFPPTEPQEYLSKRGFERVGQVAEVLA